MTSDVAEEMPHDVSAIPHFFIIVVLELFFMFCYVHSFNIYKTINTFT
jgi:hypothetical protein